MDSEPLKLKLLTPLLSIPGLTARTGLLTVTVTSCRLPGASVEIPQSQRITFSPTPCLDLNYIVCRDLEASRHITPRPPPTLNPEFITQEAAYAPRTMNELLSAQR